MRTGKSKTSKYLKSKIENFEMKATTETTNGIDAKEASKSNCVVY